MVANYAGTQGTKSVHVINQKNVINVHSNDVILPALTSRHTQREQTITALAQYSHMQCGILHMREIRKMDHEVAKNVILRYIIIPCYIQYNNI